MIAKPKNSLLPLIAGGLGVSLFSFIAGRSFAPNSVANLGTNEALGGASQSRTSEGGEVHVEREEHSEGEESHGHGSSEPIRFEGDGAREAGIKVQTVFATPLVTGLPVTGSIEPSPNRLVRVASVVPGRITQLRANVGDRVGKGQVLAVVESRSVGEAQSAFQQARARLQNARENLRVVEAQARAGVFSRAPLETARGRLIDARAEVATQENAIRSARVGLENAQKLARAGSFASPAIEAARRERAQADEDLKTARAALSSAQSGVTSAQSELERRRAIATGGGYASRPVQEAGRLLTAAQSAQNAAQSEVSTTRSNLNRSKSLAGEGLISTRDLENAQTVFDTATARLSTAKADVESAQEELARQQRLATSNVASIAEIAEAQRSLTGAQADVRTRRAEVERALQGVQLANRVLQRESSILRSGVANRREILIAQTALSTAQNALTRARATLGVAQNAFAREEHIYRANLNNSSQIQSARSQLVAAQSEMNAARAALALFKTSPGGSASIPIRAPISGIVTEREIAQGEVLDADARLLTIADNSIIHADFFVPERDIAKLRVGAPLELRADAVPGRVYNGSIELIHTMLDPKTRTVETHAEVPNPGGLLRFGMAIRGVVQSGQRTRLGLQVPAEAVQEMEGKRVVFVTDDEPNTFVAREVQVSQTVDGRTTITSGLKNGERVVVAGAFMVKAQAMKAELGHEH